ncbi:Bug family tripartite tricarboxylate transporter substrate binding protein [Variovorax sp. HJSM1_2]|uniref:Bug family tripartite tricarboxylate transporter substrate binding protein n=1 Tax=Variovorax sp. HJSM1_2 TaxID=3366263 RepID=UPI003BEBFDA4
MKTFTLLKTLSVLALTAVLSLQAAAQGPATKPITLIVPYPAGGVVDYQARLLAPGLRRSLLHDVVIENISGAAGAIGLQRLASAPGDSQEMAIGTDSDLLLAPMVNSDIRFSPAQFRLVGPIASTAMAVVAGPLPLLSLADTLTQARHDLKPLSFGNYGMGSNSQLLAQELTSRSGVNVLHVPYRGIAPLLQDLLSGQVDMAFVPLAAGIPDLVNAGKLRLLAVASRQRHRNFPQTPTLSEATGLPGLEHRSWSGLVVPRATSAAAVARLHTALQETLADGEVRSQFDKSGLETGPIISVAQAQAFLDSEIERYRQLLANKGADGGNARR